MKKIKSLFLLLSFFVLIPNSKAQNFCGLKSYSDAETCKQVVCEIQNQNLSLCEHVPKEKRICTPNVYPDDDSMLAGIQYCFGKMGNLFSCLGSSECLTNKADSLLESYLQGVQERASKVLVAISKGSLWNYFVPEQTYSPQEIYSALQLIGNALYDGVSGYNCYKRKFAFQELCDLKSGALYLSVAGGGTLALTQKELLAGLSDVLAAQRAQQSESKILALFRERLKSVKNEVNNQVYGKLTASSLNKTGLQIQSKFNDVYGKFGQIDYRSKSATSITTKLKNKGAAVKSVQDVKSSIDDGHGIRLTLNQADSKSIDQLVQTIQDQVQKGEYSILGVRNYHGKEIQPYLNSDQFNLLQQKVLNESQLKQKGIQVSPETLKSDTSIKQTGYTGMALKVYDPKSKEIIEFQIRGHNVHQIAEVEHLYYDYINGKKIPIEIENCFQKMGFVKQKDPAQLLKAAKPGERIERSNLNVLTLPRIQKDFLNYTNSLYNFARQRELGVDIQPPQIPHSLLKFEQRLNEVISQETLRSMKFGYP